VDWFENLSGLNPDAGSGTFELALGALLGGVALLIAARVTNAWIGRRRQAER